MSKTNSIKLGSKVKDRISGFAGIATSRVEFLYGCVRYLVEPEGLTPDGKPIESQYFDEQRLTDRSTVETGGPESVKSPAQRVPGRR